MRKEKFITEQHKKTRLFFRILGPALLVIGAICLIVALIDIFTLQGFEEPKFFWLFFVVMPFLFIGFLLTGVGYGGAIARFESREYAPVVKDTFNYLATETTSGIKEISKAIQDGANLTYSMRCHKCNEENPIHAKFCSHCGGKLMQICPHCEEENTAGALYCNSCGKSLG
ncbi:zinc ribbon domain-containing protein [Heyndrickxia vini]|uniref:Zinc ribbon domain-containing protein n=1 Tax=Heyndrickxia vini TaxID=1476025 RepID=A0ABX7E2V8_9BACI|nr:zinc ribbon domain-containing protein [Heyndrickxia vini]QQZ08677.1 zinc ribbon domain-containing protein [Heyndrickxia vini]